MRETITRCAAILARSPGLLVITGAGISAESGMRTYRGPGGVYDEQPDIIRELSAEGLAEHPEKVWRHINEMRIQAAAAEPNDAHRILALWEGQGRFQRFLIATQNLDGLHQKAGSGRVTELHGSLWQMARPRTVDFTEDGQFSQDVEDLEIPGKREAVLRRWSEENRREMWENRTVPFAAIPPFRDGEVRPNVLLFNEDYGSRLAWVDDFIRRAPEAVLVIGCSGGVSLLDHLLRDCRKADPDCAIMNINPHEDCIRLPHEHLSLPASEAMAALDGAWE